MKSPTLIASLAAVFTCLLLVGFMSVSGESFPPILHRTVDLRVGEVQDKSDANSVRHAPSDSAETAHVYSKEGLYLVEHISAEGIRAVARLQVRVGVE